MAKKEKFDSLLQETGGGGQIKYFVSLSTTDAGKLDIKVDEYSYQKVNKNILIDPPDQAFFDALRKLLSSELPLWDENPMSIINKPCREDIRPTGTWTSFAVVRPNGEQIWISNEKTLKQLQNFAPLRAIIDTKI